MRKILLAAIAAMAIGSLTPSASQAMPLAPSSGLLPATGQVGIVDEAQASFYIGRQRYCWYWDGWQGPGYYYCGSQWRRGYGWGGPSGWGGRRYGGSRPKGYSSGYKKSGGGGYKGGYSGGGKKSGGYSGGYKKSGGGKKGGGKKY